MILISHRGNISEINSELENSPDYIDKAIGLGFDVEIDFWLVNQSILLGHDEPQYKIQPEYLEDRKECLWIHCKNIPALNYCLNNGLHCFYHQTDDVTLTSKGYIWTFPNNKLNISERSVAVLPEKTGKWSTHKGAGICSDFIVKYLD